MPASFSACMAPRWSLASCCSAFDICESACFASAACFASLPSACLASASSCFMASCRSPDFNACDSVLALPSTSGSDASMSFRRSACSELSAFSSRPRRSSRAAARPAASASRAVASRSLSSPAGGCSICASMSFSCSRASGLSEMVSSAFATLASAASARACCSAGVTDASMPAETTGAATRTGCSHAHITSTAATTGIHGVDRGHRSANTRRTIARSAGSRAARSASCTAAWAKASLRLSSARADASRPSRPNRSSASTAARNALIGGCSCARNHATAVAAATSMANAITSPRAPNTRESTRPGNAIANPTSSAGDATSTHRCTRRRICTSLIRVDTDRTREG